MACCFAPRLPQLRAAPDVVALAFALGLSVVFAARLAVAGRDLQAHLAIAAHGRGLRRDARRRRLASEPASARRRSRHWGTDFARVVSRARSLFPGRQRLERLTLGDTQGFAALDYLSAR